MTNGSGQDQADLVAGVRDEWIALGTATEPADRGRAEWAVRSAIESTGRQTHSMAFIWVDSPLAGVLASTYVGFALGEPMKQPMSTPLDTALSREVSGVARLRQAVDDTVWRARNAVHARVAAELAVMRTPEYEWERRRAGNNAWNQIWETVGDPMYDQIFGKDARAADGLFEDNLASWADGMMEGQFGAGAMAALDAMYLLSDVDITPFDGIRRLASNCSWWWAYEVGAVLCERPSRFEVTGENLTIEYRDGWTVAT